jgi:hypothetical protein
LLEESDKRFTTQKKPIYALKWALSGVNIAENPNSPTTFRKITLQRIFEHHPNNLSKGKGNATPLQA